MDALFRAFDRLRKLDPDSFEIHAFMGGLYSQEAHYEAAVGVSGGAEEATGRCGDHSPLESRVHMLEPTWTGGEGTTLLPGLSRKRRDDFTANFYLATWRFTNTSSAKVFLT